MPDTARDPLCPYCATAACERVRRRSRLFGVACRRSHDWRAPGGGQPRRHPHGLRERRAATPTLSTRTRSDHRLSIRGRLESGMNRPAGTPLRPIRSRRAAPDARGPNQPESGLARPGGSSNSPSPLTLRAASPDFRPTVRWTRAARQIDPAAATGTRWRQRRHDEGGEKRFQSQPAQTPAPAPAPAPQGSPRPIPPTHATVPSRRGLLAHRGDHVRLLINPPDLRKSARHRERDLARTARKI